MARTAMSAQDFTDLRLGFVGAGKMAQAVIKAVINAGLIKPENIMGSARTDSTRDKLKAIGIKVGKSNEEVAKFANVTFMGVKPYQIVDVLSEFPFMTSANLVISMAAGVKLSTMAEALPQGCRVIRILPNLPVEVCAGACAVAPGPEATPGDMKMLVELLRPCGHVEQVTEPQLEVCSSVLASMYGCVAIEAMADGCVKMGLPRDMAIRMSAHSLLGSAQMVLQTGKHPGLIKDEVCSPGGTTICAVHHLEQNHFRSALIGAIEVQTLRAKELGRMAEEAKK